MIDHLKQMAVFARVVDEGSFRAAAKVFGLSPSRVSNMVSELEHFLGTTLLYRTTRMIALTNEGRMFYGRVVDMLRSAESGLNELNALSLDSVGALRISLPAFLAGGPLTTAVASFAKLHPNVAFSIVYSDNRFGLVEDGFDINVRVGWLDDSSMMSRKLADGERVLVAGTGYAAKRPGPQHLKDLEDWDWIHYKNRSDTVTSTGPSGTQECIAGYSRIEVDSIDALYHLAIQDAGATILPSFLAKRGEEAGKLVRLLPDWTLRPLGIYAVWPDKSRRESLTLLFVRYLAEQDLC
ncbi:MAG: LysR family transcriptional regulator [Alphaproteobacteria bacterium]|nr:LysR family transcriptional regulator [Alphaproteobacteria bacterium]